MSSGRYPRLLEIMDIMQDHDMEEDVDVASMWGLEASFSSAEQLGMNCSNTLRCNDLSK